MHGPNINFGDSVIGPRNHKTPITTLYPTSGHIHRNRQNQHPGLGHPRKTRQFSLPLKTVWCRVCVCAVFSFSFWYLRTKRKPETVFVFIIK